METDLALDLFHQYRSLLTTSLTSSHSLDWDSMYEYMNERNLHYNELEWVLSGDGSIVEEKESCPKSL